MNKTTLTHRFAKGLHLFVIAALLVGLALGVSPVSVAQAGQNGENGEFAVSIFHDGMWQTIAPLSFGKYPAEKQLDLCDLRPSGEVKIRIDHSGNTAAHIDAVLLGGKAPRSVAGARENAPVALKKLARTDYDVIDAQGKTLTLTFDVEDKALTLSLTARIEPERINGLPYQFPIGNLCRQLDGSSNFYTYALNSQRGILEIDGNLENETLGTPFLKAFTRPGTGHPSGFTYGWVRNDHENLYVAIDLVPDNTMDGDKDYAKVYVNTQTGLKEFKVSVPEQRWGVPGFVYTNRAVHQHKVYEFQIPFSEIGPAKTSTAETIELAFEVYGTLAVDCGDAPDSYGTLLSSNGPRHLLGEVTINLGAIVDGEPDGQPSPGADGDDLDLLYQSSGDDEDGVTLPPTLMPGVAAIITVNGGPNGGLLDAWIDFNRNGVFDHPTEHLFDPIAGTSQLLAAGLDLAIPFTVPGDATPGFTYARFRLSSEGGLLPKESAPNVDPPDGEVEDYRVEIIGVGTVVVEKVTQPTGGTGFGFTDDIAGSDSFPLDDGQTVVLPNVPAATYTVTETNPAPTFDLTDLDCEDPDSESSVDLSAGTATIDLDHGETITCTFTNTERGTIVVEKQTDPDGAGGTFAFTDDIGTPLAFNLGDDGIQTFTNVVSGTYGITETNPAPTFDLTDITCSDDNSSGDEGTGVATVSLQPGEVVTCTFTNTYAPPVPVPVGGFIVPVDKLGLLAPWMGLVGLAALATLTVALLRRRSRT